MRVLLVGPPADRLRLRAALQSSDLEIVGEFPTMVDARRAATASDALLVARDGPWPEDDERQLEPLTAREIEVLELLAQGLPNKGIAARLQISPQTVKFHVASISGKLGAANRTDAVRRAVHHGLIAL